MSEDEIVMLLPIPIDVFNVRIITPVELSVHRDDVKPYFMWGFVE